MSTAHLNIRAEVTDTFGGEANYCWVRRVEFTANRADSDRSVIRRAKILLGLTGRHTKERSGGDDITLRFPGECIVAFISFEAI